MAETAKTLEGEFAKLVKPGGTDLELAEEVVASRWGRRKGYPTAEQCTKFLIGWAVDWKELSQLDVDDDDGALAKAALNVIDKRRVLELLHERYAKWGERVARYVRREWAEEDAQEQITRKSRKVARGKSEVPLWRWAREVFEDATGPGVPKFGAEKAFISGVWDAHRRRVRDATKREFVARLLDAHRKGHLTLARADLVAAMDPELVRASELRDPQTGATYHFVRLGGSGPKHSFSSDLKRIEGSAKAPQRAGGAESMSWKIRGAYKRLASRARSPHVVIRDLWRETGIPLEALHSWLLGELKAGRADVALGEPTLASPEQLQAALVLEGRPHLYVTLDIEGSAETPQQPAEARILREFDRLDAQSGGENYVTLFALRGALPGIGRKAFDEAVNRLRKERVVSLDSADGRHVRLSPAEINAGIEEEGQWLVYMKRRT